MGPRAHATTPRCRGVTEVRNARCEGIGRGWAALRRGGPDAKTPRIAGRLVSLQLEREFLLREHFAGAALALVLHHRGPHCGMEHPWPGEDGDVADLAVANDGLCNHHAFDPVPGRRLG